MPDVEVRVIDGFELCGRLSEIPARVYGVFTRHVPALYNAAWRFTMAHPPAFRLSARLYRRHFAESIRRFQPDLILTVHSFFNIVLTRMLDRLSLRIPVVVLQADLVNIHSTWCNPRALRTVCPTPEAFSASIAQGMPPEKLKVIGFPVRGRFCDAARNTGAPEYDPSRPLRCLLISGGEGAGRLKIYAKAILEHTDAELTIVCGRNSQLQHQLQRSFLPQYSGRVKVLGFVSELEQELLRSDLLVTRGSPNTLLEAVVSAVPFIMIGPMLEQERDNPRLMQQHHLGVICASPDEIPGMISGLLADDAARLREIRAAQCAFRSFDTAREIALYVAELAGPVS